MTSLYRSPIKGTFAIYRDDKLSSDHSNDRPYLVTSPTDAPVEIRSSPVPALMSSEVDPLVLVVQLKKELDDERRRANRVEDELQMQLSSVQSSAKRDQQELKEQVRRAQEQAQDERLRREQSEAESKAERRELEEEVERLKLAVQNKEREKVELRANMQGRMNEARTKLITANELLDKEHAKRASRESIAERKFTALQQKLQVAQSNYEDSKANAAKAEMEYRAELDEAHLRHSDACQALLESEQVRMRLVEDNARLLDELSITVKNGEQAQARLCREYEARINAERDHAEEEINEGEEEVRRHCRAQVKKVEADYRARLDEAKQRLSTILRHKKTKYQTKTAELEELIDDLKMRLRRSEAEKEELRQRWSRILGRASGVMENHCSTTKRLMNDGRDSVASFLSGGPGLDEERASLASESWSLPNGPRTETPPLPSSVPELNL